ncbi:hypothetical protein OG739_36465 [Streptomyces longwoodensis]|uniref:hypothetical protein n=1 Tax=Streptomyces longwoodensis TaxID=68231 RepID=UPI0022537121|nr:hypothetical protein [Streptomyces longwoodensis]MCX5000785.1 hypothetical protein [Streptomyces longwoodensis]
MTDSHGGSPLILGGRVRRLTTVDIESVLRIVDLEELDAAALRRELTCGDDYLWAGIDLPNGSLGAVHRSMTWGNHLLLKGVFVDEVLRGSGAALELAFALRDAARGGGHSGLAAWVEPHKPEAALARMLRLRPTGPLVHRFEVPVAADGPRAAASVRSCGRITMALPRLAAQVPLVADLLTGDSPAAIQWVHDRHRLVLSGFPPSSVTDLELLVSAAAPVARANGARYLEFPAPAADLPAALFLASVKARRLSRTPVQLGRADFVTSPADISQGRKNRVCA